MTLLLIWEQITVLKMGSQKIFCTKKLSQLLQPRKLRVHNYYRCTLCIIESLENRVVRKTYTIDSQKIPSPSSQFLSSGDYEIEVLEYEKNAGFEENER